MRVARITAPVGEGRDSGAEAGRRRKRVSIGEGASREMVPNAMRAVERKVMNGEDMFVIIEDCGVWGFGLLFWKELLMRNAK